jgi:uncharacterized protein (DUF433 family)
MNINTLINVDPDILGGQPVFTGTRVPVESLFDHIGSRGFAGRISRRLSHCD